MNILVYLGSNLGNDYKFREAALEVADWICDNENDLVYGGNSNGLMGVLANRVKQRGRKVIGIMPGFLTDFEEKNLECDEFIMTETMGERKDKMRELSSVCIALPGGPGTMEEITEAFSLYVVGQNACPCIFYNKDGYYDPMKNMYDKMVEFGFLTKENRNNLLFSEDFEEINEFIKERLNV